MDGGLGGEDGEGMFGENWGIIRDCWVFCGEFDVVDWVDWWNGLSAGFCKED